MLNFPDGVAPAPKPRTLISQYRGVSKNHKKWCAVIEKKKIGNFEDELSAARAYDARARELGLDDYCNFPDDEGPPPQRNRRERGPETSEYRGVSTDHRDGRKAPYRANFNTKYLGHYEDEVSAARAYDKEARKRGKHDWCNFRKKPRK